ncbi:MAG: restriction endonuclease subunit S [Dehalococcoidia bacterium]
MIPSEWQEKPLREISLMHGRIGWQGLTQAEFTSNAEDPFLITGVDFRDGGIDWDTAYHVSHERYDVAPQIQLRSGDVLMTKDGTIGKMLYVEHIPYPGLATLNSHLLVLRPIHNSYIPSFLFYQMLSRRFSEYIEQNKSGSTFFGLSQEATGRYMTLLPPLAEQEAIAAALSDADALIEALEQLIAKKRQIKQGAMQELLTGKRRLPGFFSHAMSKTEIGDFPSDWSIVSLGFIVDQKRRIRYGIVQPGIFYPNGRYMIRGQDYSEAKGWAAPEHVFRVSPLIEEKYRNARVREGDLIMTIVGYCGHVEMVPSWLDGANLTQTTARIAIDSARANPIFCKYTLQSQAVRGQVVNFLKGAAQPGLNCGDVEQFLVPLPPIKEQTAIATILSDMDADIVALEKKLAKARQVKQGMMQELLTGRIRLV